MGDPAKYVKLVTRERGRLRRLSPPLLADTLGAARSSRGEGHGCSAPADAPPAARDRSSLVAAADRLDLTRCPGCRQGRLHVVGLLRPGALPVPVWDTP